ncbi:MAG TPA: nuclear transport factor 2 family protein [Xanthomonadales bacterium]|nr:nuclear transport factor 2 family protein [Xanthomonadales bacterium]
MTRVLLSVAVALLAAEAAVAVEFDDLQKAVWQMEEDYWRIVASGDPEGYSALFHENFIGWPCTSETPKGTTNSAAWVEEIRDNNWTLNYQLRPEAVHLFGDTSVIHYAAEYVFEYGDGTSKGKGDWRKFTHTWKKYDDKWLLIGGMCADVKPVRSLLK